MKGVSTIIILIILLVSCEKDDIQPSYPSVYFKSGVQAIGNTRLFSKQGEILDPLIIKRFYEKDSSWLDGVARGLEKDLTMDTVRFLDRQRAVVVDGNFPYNCSVQTDIDRLILARSDTSFGFWTGDLYTRSLHYHAGQVKPEILYEYLESSVRGNYQFGYAFRPIFVLKETSGQFVAPIQLFSHYRGTYNFSLGFQNNDLQIDFTNWFENQDTVVLKQYQITYKK
jgi:hypothetical protein